MSKNFDLIHKPSRSESVVAAAPARARIVAPAENEWNSRNNDSINFARAFLILGKYWKLSAGFAALVFFSVLAFTLLSQPIYEPVASIEVSPPGTEMFRLEEHSVEPDSTEYLGTQVKTLESSELALSVIRGLHLDQDPEFIGSHKRHGSPLSSNGNAVQLSDPESAALRTFQKNLTIDRDTASRVVMVKFASHDARKAAEIVNTLISDYIEQNYESRHAAILKSTEWLSRQLDDIRAGMATANQELAEFQKQTGIAELDANRNTVADQMSELNRQLALAQAERIQSESYLHSADRRPDTLPQYQSSPVVMALSQKLAEARADLSQSLVLYGPNHPKVKQAEGQAKELEAQLDLQKRAVVAELSTHYGAGISREELLQREIKNSTRDLNNVARYNELKKQAQAQTDLYNSLFARVKEAGIAAAAKSANVRVVDPARVLDIPTRPRVALNLAMGLLAGVFGGLILGFVVEGVDSSIHTVDDIYQATGIATISMLPRIEADRSRMPGALGRRDGSSGAFMLDRPGSPESEALRGLYASIMLPRAGTPPQVVAIVSAFPGDGKTTVASNLAIALSQQGATCLVDGDLRNASAAKSFGISGPGLGDVLFGTLALGDTIQKVSGVPNLSVLPAGNAPRNPAELFVGGVLRDVMGLLRRRFKFIVIDSPPILSYIDGRILSTLADGVVFVGRSGVTPRDAMKRGIDLLLEINAAPILDIVLNGASIANESRYGRYRA